MKKISTPIRREIANLLKLQKHELYYIIEKRNWSIQWDGKYITSELNKQKLISATLGRRRDAKIAKNKIIHFGSRNLYLPNMFDQVHPSNKVVFTWFHGTDEDTVFIKTLKKSIDYFDLLHTSCNISKENLIRWGVPEEKIVVIPLGVDLETFHPISEAEKDARRKKLGIPKDSIVISSFQKDGNGWEEGLEPKLIKGPDILCNVCIELSKKYPIHILLTGPARGYVKTRLEEAGVPYTHNYLENFLDVAWYYPLADICLVSSRAEGGPKAILEGMASGVPIVSTRVGMAPDIISDGENGFLAEIEDANNLTEHCSALIADKNLSEWVVQNGLKTAEHFSWATIAKEYFRKLYS